MRIYNTLTRKKEELKTVTPNEVKIYACGPTVYNFIHIGNARPLCVFDTFRRYLEYRGYKVNFVQNFTDIDDKIIKRANEEGTDYKTVSEKYIAEFWTDVKGMNIREATVHPKATENIDEILSIIETLVEKGYAYPVENGDVYFSPKKFNEYGKLSHQPLEDLEAGARINIGELKKEPMDFALWKGAKPGEPAWDSPWGKGRPGWHIECSAMVRRYLGETIDIHCGGQDLIFPHHENEIAQSECCNGVPFANYWMHNGYINVDNVKMSKSLGNFFTVRDVAEKYGYVAVKIEDGKRYAGDGVSENAETVKAQLDSRRAQFCKAMDDDLNTADGIAAVFELVRDINVSVLESDSKSLIEYAIGLFDELTGVLGLVYNRKTDNLDSEIEALIEARQAARKAKNWAEADRIRDELKNQGIVLEDTPQGVKWHRV